MARQCVNCGKGILRHAIKDAPDQCRGHASVAPKIAGWHYTKCHEVEFDLGEGKRLAQII
jgi:hypothetical protein